MSSECNQVTYESGLVGEITSITKRVVSKYTARRVIPKREMEDVEMAILEKFIKQKEQILKAFEGKAKFSTYCMAIVNRMCCEVIRKESRHWYAVHEEELLPGQYEQSTPSIETEKNAVLHSEILRLKQILLFFNEESTKVLLFLKYYFDLPIGKSDVFAYCPTREKRLLDIFINPREGLSKGELFERLAEVVNLVENRKVKGDAVRMWLNKQIEALLIRLNGMGGSRHTKESLALLFELLAENTS
jgi:DNA-directed RNA polymerase specialized sigma24 family protein